MVQGGQFAIMHEPIMRHKYTSIMLTDGWYLSYYEDLPVYRDAEKDVILIGYAWQTMEGLKTPQETIDSSESPEEIVEAEENWAGRYVLIVKGRVFTDAAALFGVFYSKDGIASDISFLVNSKDEEKNKWEPSEKLQWYPGPGTLYPAIWRLMPSQVLNYRKNKIYPRNPAQTHVPSYNNTQALTEAFAEMLCSSLKGMQKLFPEKKILVELKPDADSLLLLALAKMADIPFECFVMGENGIADDTLTEMREACARVGVKLRYHTRDEQRNTMRREHEYMRHTSHMSKGEGYEMYVYRQYQDIIDEYADAVILRHDMARMAADFSRKYETDDLTAVNVLDEYLVRTGAPEATSLATCLDWIQNNMFDALTVKERFIWEQVWGCRLAEEERAFDIYDSLVSFQLLNCRRLIAMLLQYAEEDRDAGTYKERLIACAAPGLKDYDLSVGIDVNGNWLEHAGDAIKEFGVRLFKTGVGRTAKYCAAGAKKRLSKIEIHLPKFSKPYDDDEDDDYDDYEEAEAEEADVTEEETASEEEEETDAGEPAEGDKKKSET